ncbi:MAG TPA: copper resistance protein B [Allosphingosinicella sp.]|jgi:copper resistance protein B
MRSLAFAPILLASLALVTPAAAQRLPYRPVVADELAGGARLAYRPVEGDSAPTAPEASGAGSKRRKLLRWGLLDRFEYAAQRGQDGYSWDLSALLGGERDRLWLASVGEGSAWSAPGYLELHALYSRYVGSDTDLNLGLRWDPVSPGRAYATAGGQYDDDKLWIGAFTYLSHKGELGARLAALHNLGVTKALFLQPTFEVDLSGVDVPELGIGRGFYYAEAGLRLRYEIKEAFAPYVGLSWERSLGRTARWEREAGEDPETKGLVLGVRSAF